MSFLRVVLVLLFGFSLSPLLMGMEKKQKLTTFKYSNPYFDSELQKSLTLIMLKNRNAEEVVALDKDVLKIIAKNSYNLHQKRLFASLGSWCSWDRDNLRRINSYINKDKGYYDKQWHAAIDFDFVTMNDKGRKKFLKLGNGIFHDNDDKYSSNTIDQKTLEDYKEHDYYRFISILNNDTYNAVLKVPVRLRSKVGKLRTITVICEEYISFWDHCEGIIRMFIGGDALKKQKQNKVFKVVEKPLITPEEQKMIKQTEKFESLTKKLSKNIQSGRLNLRSRE